MSKTLTAQDANTFWNLIDLVKKDPNHSITINSDKPITLNTRADDRLSVIKLILGSSFKNRIHLYESEIKATQDLFDLGFIISPSNLPYIPGGHGCQFTPKCKDYIEYSEAKNQQPTFSPESIEEFQTFKMNQEAKHTVECFEDYQTFGDQELLELSKGHYNKYKSYGGIKSMNDLHGYKIDNVEKKIDWFNFNTIELAQKSLLKQSDQASITLSSNDSNDIIKIHNWWNKCTKAKLIELVSFGISGAVCTYNYRLTKDGADYVKTGGNWSQQSIDQIIEINQTRELDKMTQELASHSFKNTKPINEVETLKSLEEKFKVHHAKYYNNIFYKKETASDSDLLKVDSYYRAYKLIGGTETREQLELESNRKLTSDEVDIFRALITLKAHMPGLQRHENKFKFDTNALNDGILPRLNIFETFGMSDKTSSITIDFETKQIIFHSSDGQSSVHFNKYLNRFRDNIYVWLKKHLPVNEQYKISQFNITQPDSSLFRQQIINKIKTAYPGYGTHKISISKNLEIDHICQELIESGMLRYDDTIISDSLKTYALTKMALKYREDPKADWSLKSISEFKKTYDMKNKTFTASGDLTGFTTKPLTGFTVNKNGEKFVDTKQVLTSTNVQPTSESAKTAEYDSWINGTIITEPISGTITSNGSSTQGSIALDSSVPELTVSQNTSPSYTAGKINPLFYRTEGVLRVDNSGVTQPVSGTVTANLLQTEILPSHEDRINGNIDSRKTITSIFRNVWIHNKQNANSSLDAYLCGKEPEFAQEFVNYKFVEKGYNVSNYMNFKITDKCKAYLDSGGDWSKESIDKFNLSYTQEPIDAQKIIVSDSAISWFAPNIYKIDDKVLTDSELDDEFYKELEFKIDEIDNKNDSKKITSKDIFEKTQAIHDLSKKYYPDIIESDIVNESTKKIAQEMDQQILFELDNVASIDPIYPPDFFNKVYDIKSLKLPDAKPSFSNILKTNAISASYRVAATQANKLVMTGIKVAIAKNTSDNQTLETIGKFLDTEYGNALVSMMLGSGLMYAPKIKDDSRVQKLAEELRINGMTMAGNEFITNIMAEILPALIKTLNELPSLEQETSTRVQETKIESDESILEEYLEINQTDLLALAKN